MKKRSDFVGLLDLFEPIYNALPEIKQPIKEVPLKKKLIWTGIALLLFYIMGNITLIGLAGVKGDELTNLQVILASNIGTLITAGISPIVLSSIILQLLVGGKIIDIDLSQPKDKARFQGLQKLFAVALCLFEGVIYVASGMLEPSEGMFLIIVAQVALGSIILLYLDELVSKYGIGSGVGLFIAGGVTGSFLWLVLRPPLTIGDPGGAISQFIGSLATGVNFVILIPIFIAIAIFMIIVFAEGMHVNLPITMGRKGTGGRFPVKLLYVSNIPVILAVALFANFQWWSLMVADLELPIIGKGIGWVIGGFAYYTTAPYGLFADIISRVGAEGMDGLFFMSGDLFHALIYMIILVTACIVFGKFWVEMGGQGAEAVSKQLSGSGMYIPGFRRDSRIIRQVLDRYIPPIVILGSIFVALLAGFGDMTLNGLSSGTGILLTVGIVYRLYEELAKEQMMETNPLFKRFFG